MRRLILFLLPVFAIILQLPLGSCSDSDEDQIEGKWQMRRVSSENHADVSIDSVFFNFMDGVFTAICIGPKGEYADFYGKYIYGGDEIQILSLRPTVPQYSWDIPAESSSQRFVRYWPDGNKTFRVLSVSSSSMQLSSNDSTFVFRKY